MSDDMKPAPPVEQTKEEGIPCPECGCRHHETFRTTKAMKKIRRVRICRHCGRKFTTFEVIPE